MSLWKQIRVTKGRKGIREYIMEEGPYEPYTNEQINLKINFTKNIRDGKGEKIQRDIYNVKGNVL